MSAPRSAPAGVAEPRATIYDPEWQDARDRLEGVRDEDARALLTSAMDQVQSGWDVVGALQRWAEQNRDPERPDNDYGALLTFTESEVQDVYRLMASDLAEWAREWPGADLPPGNDVDNRLSEFGRYVTVLVLGTGTALDVPDAFRQLVHQAVRLRPGGEWYRRLADTLAAIQVASDREITADGARQAVDLLLHALPESDRDRASGQLLVNLEDLYAALGPPPPEWVAVLKTYFSEQVQSQAEAGY